jgi:uncharacterized protein YcbK (DUF882 family)
VYCPKRRQILRTAALALPAAALPGLGLAASGPRRLRFYHTHTGEKLDVVYHEYGAYLPDALDEINHVLRDFRSDDAFRMDPALLDFLHAAQNRVGSTGSAEIISAYRSPATNEMLRKSGAGVARRSQHLKGKAIDVRLTDVTTEDLRRASLDLARGGVGYYPKSDFVHLDTGRVRWW